MIILSKKIAVLFLTVLGFFSLSACTNSLVTYNIYVTVYPLEYLVDSLLTDTDITCGMVPGVTSHNESVDWAPKQIIAMTEAKYLFYIGAFFDTYIDNQISTIFTDEEVTLVKLETEFDVNGVNSLLIEGVSHHSHDDEEDDEATDTEIGLDPHFWISPKRMIQVVGLLYTKLIDAQTGYPELASTIATNRDNLLAILSSLDAAYDAAINPESKTVLTSTNLYGYLKADYGLKTISISPGYHEENDVAIAQDRESILSQAQANSIRHIIYEVNASSPASDDIFTALTALGLNPVKLYYNTMPSLSDSDRAQNIDYYQIMQYTNLALLITATNIEE